MRQKDVILKRQKVKLRFKNGDMDFMLNWLIGISQIIGMSTSQIYYALRNVQDGNPNQWRDAFWELGDYQMEMANYYANQSFHSAVAQMHFGAAYAYRFSLQYTSPYFSEFEKRIRQMETAFQAACQSARLPINSVEIPFENGALPGYYLRHSDERPTVMMIGGGDTFREDLFYFAGYPSLCRGYNALMVDLPGQGATPLRGLYFRVNMEESIKAIIDWLHVNHPSAARNISVFGVSGGGYLSALAVENESRIKAWIAATPIYDLGKLMKNEFGAVMNAPSWILNLVLKISGSFNEASKINIEKYAWQYGTDDFKKVIQEIGKQAKIVDINKLCAKSLFLVSEGEGEELKKQTKEIYDNLRSRNISATLIDFPAELGADAHCQVNNLRLAHNVIFDWLDGNFASDKT